MREEVWFGQSNVSWCIHYATNDIKSSFTKSMFISIYSQFRKLKETSHS